MHPATPDEGDIDLLILVPDVRPGGVTTHSAHLARAALARGLRVHVLPVTAGTGISSLHDLDVVGPPIVDVPASRLLDVLRRSTTVVLQASPATLPLVSVLGLAGAAVVAVHGSPGTNTSWWGEAQVEVLASMRRDGAPVPVVVPGAAYRGGVAAELGVDEAAVHVANNATDPHLAEELPTPGTSCITVPMRLARDKSWVLDAGIALARAGAVPLRLVGEGPHVESLVGELQSSGLEYDVVRTADLSAELAAADVVVGVGLVALEAAARGRRVAVAAKGEARRFVGVVHAGSWDELQSGNFAGIGADRSFSAEAAWESVKSLSLDDLARLPRIVADQASPAALLDAVLAAAQPVSGPAAGRRTVGALLRVNAAQASRLAQYDGWVVQLQGQLAKETASVVDLQEQLSRETASLEQLVRSRRELTTELESAQEQMQHLTAERDVTAAVADDAYRQLGEIYASTAWRVASPVRALGHLRRRATSLLPFLNARRLRAAARLAVRGDLAAIRQRIEATAAVAATSQAWTSASRRPVERREAEPWDPEVPIVSVVIPCFNYGEFVEEAIVSVLGQTLGPRVEIIVVDGGSTDPSTQARMIELAASPPPRTQVLLRTDGRHLVGDNRNYGIDHASGRYVACLDADDVLHPNYLEVAVFLLERFGYDVVSTATKCFGRMDDTFGILPEPDLEDMTLANNVTTVAVYRRELWRRAGGYHDTGLGAEHVHEDWRLWVRFAALGARIHNIVGQELFLYRVHDQESLSRQAGVPGVSNQRETIRKLNADVLTDDAFQRSARGREVEIIVDGSLDNLRIGPHHERPGILLCVPFLLVGGAERLLSGIVSYLRSHGFRVVVITTLPAERSFGDTTEWFTDAGAEVFHLPRLLAPHRWPDFVDHLIQNKRIDIVWLAGSAFAYDLLPAMRREHPHVRVADLLFNTVGHTVSNRRYASLIDLHLCENAEVEQWLRRNGHVSERVLRVESGIDLEAYRPIRTSVALPLRIGFSGRLSKEKDPLAFIDVAEAGRDHRLDFVMTGAGPMEGKVRARVARSKHAVEFLGVVDDIASHIADLDVLVVPSRADGRPIAVLEALALGVPVLATRVGGLPTLVQDGVSGWLVAPGDVSAMVEVVRRLADDPAEVARMRLSARRFAEEHLDATAMHHGYERALRSLLDP